MSGSASQVELFAVQARVGLEDYGSPEAFAAHHRALAARVDALRARDAEGRPVHPALAVWPELVGAPLGFMGHLERVRDCRTLRKAMAAVARAEWPRMLGALGKGPRSTAEALYAALAPRVHHAVWTTFSRIARDFQLWVVAGSALLPESRLGQDTPAFRAASARTYNVSYTFAPDGSCIAATRKVNLLPTQEDALGLSAGLPEELPVVDTPLGRLGTLLSYDGFREPHTGAEPGFTPAALLLDSLAVDLVAHPSMNPWPWEGTWAFNAPGEGQRRCEQWFSEGLFAQMRDLSHVRYAISPQLVGSLFEATFEAPSLILERRGEGDVRVLAQAGDPRAECVLQVTVPRPGEAVVPRAASGGA